MAGRYIGPMNEYPRGPVTRTAPMRGRVQVLVQRLLDRMKMGGFKVLSGTEVQADGSVIVVWAQMNGLHPVVKTQVFAPSPTKRILQPKLPSVWVAPFVWEPEGFVITPRSKSLATQGWGMPRLTMQYDASKVDLKERYALRPVDEQQAAKEREEAIQAVQGDDEAVALAEVALYQGRGTAYNSHHYNELEGDGAEKKVFINQFRGNKKPEVLFEVLLAQLVDGEIVSPSQAEHLRRKMTPTTWPLFFGDGDLLVVRASHPDGVSTLFGWQFEQTLDNPEEQEPWERGAKVPRQQVRREAEFDRSIRLIEELPVSDTWFCHWPKESPYTDPFRLELFRLVNEARAAADRPPLCFPTDPASVSAELTLVQMQKHRTMAHNSERYDYRYRGLFSRASMDGMPSGFGENLIGGLRLTEEDREGIDADTPYANELALATKANQIWTNSPGHYANMIAEWNRAEYSPIHPFQSARSGELRLTKGPALFRYVGPPNNQWTETEYDPEISGISAVEHFFATRDFQSLCGQMSWESGTGEVVSWMTDRPFRYALIRTRPSVFFKHPEWDTPSNHELATEIQFMAQFWVFYRGRGVRFADNFRVMGAAICGKELRAALYDTLKHEIVLVSSPLAVTYEETDESDIEEAAVDITILTRYRLTSNDYAVSFAHFSQDGSKCVFPVVSGGSGVNRKFGIVNETKKEAYLSWVKIGGHNFATYSYNPTYGSTNPPAEHDATWSQIRHVVLEEAGGTVVSQFEPECQRDVFNGKYNYSFSGQGNIYADYVDNRLVFAHVTLEFDTKSHVMEKTLHWPGGSLVVQKSDIAYFTLDRAAEIEYRLVELLHFDLRHPEDITYSELDSSGYPKGEGRYRTPVERKLYVRGEHVWTSAPTPRHIDSESFGSVRNVKFDDYKFSAEAPKAYMRQLQTAGGGMYFGRFLSLGWHQAALLGELNVYGAFIATWWSQSGYERKGLLDEFWHADRMGFTALDEVAQNGLYDKGDHGVIGGSPSFMPWVQKRSLQWGYFLSDSIIHETQAQFVRYKDDYIFQAFQPFWLAQLPLVSDMPYDSIPLNPETEVTYFACPAGTFSNGSKCYTVAPDGSWEYSCDIQEVTLPVTYVDGDVAFPSLWYNDPHRQAGTPGGHTPGYNPYDHPVGEAYTAQYNNYLLWLNEPSKRSYWYGVTGVHFTEHDNCWLRFSSLDLAEITGVDDLANNISPLGVV
jgi:hypothetical protein